MINPDPADHRDDPAYARDEPQYMDLDGQREYEKRLAALGWSLPIQPTDEQRAFMREVYVRGVREKVATAAGPARYYLLTARGRLAAEKTDEMMCTQIDATRENKS